MIIQCCMPDCYNPARVRAENLITGAHVYYCIECTQRVKIFVRDDWIIVSDIPEQSDNAVLCPVSSVGIIWEKEY